MPPDRFLEDTLAEESPTSGQIQQLVEAEHGRGAQGINRRWQASDSSRVVLTSDSTGVKISDNNGVAPPSHVIVDGSQAGGGLAGTYPNPSLSASAIDALIPPGVIWAYAAGGAPAGWLYCDGSAVSRTTYVKLFNVIGTTWGPGNGSTTFNLPNLVGRFLFGSGTVTFGTYGGFLTSPGPAHTHPGTHSHGLNSHTHGPGLHTHGPGIHTHGLGTHVHAQSSHTHGLAGHVHTSASHNHDINHDHGASTATASASALNGRFTAGGENALPDTHTHPVDLPGLGTVVSGSTAPGDTGSPTPAAADTSGTSAANTGGPSASASTDTSGPSANNTAGPSANDTAAATGATATDNTAPAATYSETIPIMPPFGVASYIIRSGVP